MSEEDDEHCSSIAKETESSKGSSAVTMDSKVTIDNRRQVDGPYSWLICVCGSLANITALGCAYTSGILFPYLLDEFRSGKAVTAFAGSFAVASGCLFGPLAGKLCDRFGCRVVMVGSGLTCAVGLLGSGFAPNIETLYLTYGLVFGVSSCLVYVAAIVIVPQYFDKRISVATAMVTAGPGAGLLVMSPVVEALSTLLGWRKAMMAMAAIMLIPCIVGWSFPSRKTAKIREPTRRAGEDDVTFHQCFKFVDVSVFKDRLFILYTVAMATTILGHVMPIAHLANHCKELGIPSDRSSWLYFCIGLASFISRLLTGRLCDTQRVTLSHVFQIGAFTLAAADFLLPLATHYDWLLVYSLTYGTAEGVVTTSMHCRTLTSLPPHLIGQGFGWYLAFLGVAFAIGPILAGFIADISGSYTLTFYTAGSLVLVGAVVPFLARFNGKTDEEQLRFSQYSTNSRLIVFEKESSV